MSENFLDCEFKVRARVPRSFHIFIGAAWRKHGLRPNELAILFNLVSRMDQDNECYPSTRVLAQECQMARCSVFVALKGLKEKGFIEWQNQVHGNNGDGPNLYAIIGHPDLRGGIGLTDTPRIGLTDTPVYAKQTRSLNHIEGETNKSSPSQFSLNGDSNPKRKKAPRAQSFSEVLSFCAKNQMIEADARYLWCHWEGNGWTNHNKPMRSWKDTAIAWRETHRILPSHTNGGGRNGRRA